MLMKRDALFGGKPEPVKPNVTVYPGHPGAAAANAASTPAQPASPPPQPVRAEAASRPLGEDGGSRLVVGPEVKLKGAQITDCHTLVVEGSVEATMDSKVIQIAERGAYTGSVAIDVAEIHGRFEGELTARRKLVIHGSGRVSGKVRYGSLVIEEGGELTGDVANLSDQRPTSRVEPLRAGMDGG